MDIMATLARNILSVNFDDLPSEAVDAAKRAIIDNLGVTIAGSSAKGCQLLVKHLKEWGGPSESTIAVFGGKAPASLAAQANGAMARAMEIDDVSDAFPLHPCMAIIPACMAIAERHGGVDGKRLITAVALGQDLIFRMAKATKVSPITSGRYNLFRIFASTGAAGKILELNEEEFLNAMGISYSQMVGDGQAARDGAMTNYIQAGTAAKSSIESVLLAQAGITGAKNVLQGKSGFYTAIEPDHNLEYLTSDLGKRFMGVETCIKPYTACRMAHEAIDLALEIRSEHSIVPSFIEKIVVSVNEECHNIVCEPLEQKRHPKTMVDAQFSLPYAVAAAIIRGDFFLVELGDQVINDPEILELTQKVIPIVDDKCESELAVGSTTMEMVTQDGQRFVKKTHYPKGNFLNPISSEELIEKFKKCTAHSIKPFSDGDVDKMIELLCNLDEVGDVAEIAEMLAPK